MQVTRDSFSFCIIYLGLVLCVIAEPSTCRSARTCADAVRACQSVLIDTSAYAHTHTHTHTHMTTTTTTRPLKSVWMVSLCRLEACSSTKRPVSNFSRRFLSQPLTAAPPTIRSASITTCVCVRACVRGDANALVRSERRLYLCIYSFLYI